MLGYLSLGVTLLKCVVYWTGAQGRKRFLCERSLTPNDTGVGGVDLVGLSEQRVSFGGTPSLTSPAGSSGRACRSTPFLHYQLFLLYIIRILVLYILNFLFLFFEIDLLPLSFINNLINHQSHS